MGPSVAGDPRPVALNRVLVRPAAAADIDDAYRWYEERRAGLGREFLAALNEVVTFVRKHPDTSPVVHRDTRRALIRKRFPYGLFYRWHGDVIIVIACLHVKRDPRAWKARAARPLK